jgi:hypothetical protein
MGVEGFLQVAVSKAHRPAASHRSGSNLVPVRFRYSPKTSGPRRPTGLARRAGIGCTATTRNVADSIAKGDPRKSQAGSTVRNMEDSQMKKRTSVWLLLCMFLACCPLTFAQGTAQSQSPEKQAVPSAPTDTQEKNIQEYIELLRTDVRQQKGEIMGAMMALSVDQAAKFWPIYSQYDAELTKLNNLRVANIQEYARNYDHMTDAKADELVRKALDYRRQRSQLLAKYYGRVKASLGAIEAARFLQIESQLLSIIDLQIDEALPIVGQGS